MTEPNSAFSPDASVLARLAQVIAERKANPSGKSYTASLLAGGPPKIGKKIVEEAHEVVEASQESGPGAREHVIHEAADVLYHLLVLLGWCDVPLSEVEAELGRRFGVSGLDEKASRPPKDGAGNDAPAVG
ncbi:MAG TPA: phosphoribosyl-ATP diphosphatase [Pirellulales bacterium]